MDDSYLKQGEL